MASLNDVIGQAWIEGISKLITSTITFLPNLIGAVLILLVGWVVGKIAAKIIERVLQLIKFEEVMKQHKMEDSLGTVKLSLVFEKTIQFYLVFIFLQQAVSVLGLASLTEFLMTLVNYAPVAIGSFLLFVISAMIGEFIKERIIELQPKSNLVTVSARGTKAVIVFFGIMVGLGTMGFDTSVVNQTFLSVVQAIMYGLALAFGLAFGLGGQDDAKDVIKKVRDKFKL